MTLHRPFLVSVTRTTWGGFIKQFQRLAHSSSSDDRDFDTPRGTHLNLLNDPDEGYNHIYINRYSTKGFSLSNGLELEGPMVFFPRSFLSWKIKNCTDINEESLSLFKALYPKLDVLIIGKGSAKATISNNVIKFLRQNKINFEILPTDKAIPTFNFMSAEQRWIAAALIPPEYIMDSLASDIKQQMITEDQRARLEDSDDENADTLLEHYDVPQKKQIKGLDQRLMDALAPDRKEGDLNMFGYPIEYSPLEVNIEKTEALTSKQVPVDKRLNHENDEIRFIRKSEIQKKYKEAEKIVFPKSPLDTGERFNELSSSDDGKIVGGGMKDGRDKKD